MKRYIAFLIGSFWFCCSINAQTNQHLGTLKNVQGKLYVETDGKDYLANTTTVTVKLKDNVSEDELGVNKIRKNKLGYIDITVPNIEAE